MEYRRVQSIFIAKYTQCAAGLKYDTADLFQVLAYQVLAPRARSVGCDKETAGVATERYIARMSCNHDRSESVDGSCGLR